MVISLDKPTAFLLAIATTPCYTQNIPELKDALPRIWTAWLQKSIAKGVNNFFKWLETNVSANGGNFEYKM